MHLNLVRSCETPSDPTRCELPPCCPPRGCVQARAAARVLCLAPRKPSLFLACSRILRGFRASCCTSLSFINALQCSAFRAACQALRPCAVSVSFPLCVFSLASLAALAALLCCSGTLASLASAADSLAPMLHSVADSLHLVKPYGSAAAPALLLVARHYSRSGSLVLDSFTRCCS